MKHFVIILMTAPVLAGWQPSSAQDREGPMFAPEVCDEEDLVNGDYAVEVYDQINFSHYIATKSYKSYARVYNNSVVVIWVDADLPGKGEVWSEYDFPSKAPSSCRFKGGQITCSNGRYSALLFRHPDSEDESRQLWVALKTEKEW